MELSILKDAWNEFASTGTINENVRPMVAKSWKNCVDHGLNPNDDLGFGIPCKMEEYQRLYKENETLLKVATPIMEKVHSTLATTDSLLVLTDNQGYILKTIGDIELQIISKRMFLQEGSKWDSLTVGCNSVGVVLETGEPIQMRGPEHFYRSHHDWTCTAAPIFGVEDELIGCIDISGPITDPHPHTLALVTAIAHNIENTLDRMHKAQLMQIAINGSNDCVILLNSSLKPIYINQVAQQNLNIYKENFNKYYFKNIMPDIDWHKMSKQEDKKLYVTDNTRVILNGEIAYYSATISSSYHLGSTSYTINLTKQNQIINSVNKFSGNRATYSFDSIFAKSNTMQETINLAKNYASYDGHVLIEGETGTGKEMFAQAIHMHSNRSEGPFVAINCATLPRELIESELFGYEVGAFTGASKEGKPGKFELANNGTLFLDEIGEMPLEFQAKLLRIVETLRFQRIGGTQDQILNVRIIAATNRNLKLESEQGNFRHDLYFRLNVLKLQIIPLRERKDDIAHYAELFLERLNERYPERRKYISQSYVEALKAYPWYGNVRELQNYIERTFYTSMNELLQAEDFVVETPNKQAKQSKYNAPDRDDPYEAIDLNNENLTMHNKMTDVIRLYKGDVVASAKALGVSRATFYRMCTRYDVEPKKIKKSVDKNLSEIY